jgi:hypothetical protein
MLGEGEGCRVFIQWRISVWTVLTNASPSPSPTLPTCLGPNCMQSTIINFGASIHGPSSIVLIVSAITKSGRERTVPLAPWHDPHTSARLIRHVQPLWHMGIGPLIRFTPGMHEHFVPRHGRTIVPRIFDGVRQKSKQSTWQQEVVRRVRVFKIPKPRVFI